MSQPADLEKQTFTRAADWLHHSRLLIHPTRLKQVRALQLKGEPIPVPASNEPGDGSLGILEGYSSTIQPDGHQLQLSAARADCNAESAMVLALHARLNNAKRSREVATNLLDYVYRTSGMQGGVRGDPTHPAFGLIAWGAVSPTWERATYGDDQARVILSTLLASAALNTDQWDQNLLRALLANLRTTGKLGFRGDRIDIPDLEKNGWKHYHSAANINYSPHFESGLWACYLWAYRQTGHREFLDKTKSAIRMTMAAFPKQWRWGDNMERARMLLCLAWLVRIEDTPEHRDWLLKIARDLVSQQHKTGAIPDRLAGAGGGHYKIPAKNEDYGVAESPLIQKNGDPATDQLYTTGFALLGLHEAVAATGDPDLRKAEDRLAEYLCRIQVRSTRFAYLDGAWFRAFDFERWDYYASSADLGWGAWSAEAGWGPAWTAATLALRLQRTSLWDLTANNQLKRHWADVQDQMRLNDGSPWKGKPWTGAEN